MLLPLLLTGLCVVMTPASAKVERLSDLFDNAGAVGGDVNAAGEVVLPDAEASIDLRSDSAEDQRIRLPKNKRLVFRNQGASLKVTDLLGGAVLVTRKVRGRTLVELAGGTARFEPEDDKAPIPLLRRGDGQVLALSALSRGPAPQVLLRRQDDGSAAAFVESGESELQSVRATGNSGARRGSVYAGETLQLAADGALQRLRLGSLDGDRGLPGDPLSDLPDLPPRVAGMVVPRLQGAVPRLASGNSEGGELLDLIRRQLDLRQGGANGTSTLSLNPRSGVLTYQGPRGRWHLLPLGSIELAPVGLFSGQEGFAASDAGSTVSGSFTLTERGVQLTLTSALGYFSEFDAAVKAYDSAGKLTLAANGGLWIDALGATLVVQPGMSSENTGITGSPSISAGGDGWLRFRDSQGGQQVLYPTLADPDTLQQSLRQLDPAASLSLPGDGTAVVGVGGARYVFVPDYSVPPLPAEYGGQPWWLDSQGLLNYATGSSRSGRHQGLRGR